jgi:hypothetical protein
VARRLSIVVLGIALLLMVAAQAHADTSLCGWVRC